MGTERKAGEQAIQHQKKEAAAEGTWQHGCLGLRSRDI